MIKDFSIFISNMCNFSCTYCDKSYTQIQGFSQSDLDYIVDFYKKNESIIDSNGCVSFFGGEPLIFVDQIEYLMERLPANEYLIQTNGSLILNNMEFISKYKDKLYVSISYDFISQKQRLQKDKLSFDINGTLSFLTAELPTNRIQLQSVLQPEVLQTKISTEFIDSVISLYDSYKIAKLSMIILKNIFNGCNYSKFTLENMNMLELFSILMKYIDIFHKHGCSVAIDGFFDWSNVHSYTNDSYLQQIVLCGDGLIYPDYDFFIRKKPDISIGLWKNNTQLSAAKNINLLYNKCKECLYVNYCTLKVLDILYDVDKVINFDCKNYMKMFSCIIEYNSRLNNGLSPL